MPDKEILSQMNLLSFGLAHGGHLDTIIALWDDLVRETKTIEPIAQHDWRSFRAFVSYTFSFSISFATYLHGIQPYFVPRSVDAHVSP